MYTNFHGNFWHIFGYLEARNGGIVVENVVGACKILNILKTCKTQGVTRKY